MHEEWKDLEDLESSAKGRAVMSRYGAFPAILYWRLKKSKIFKPATVEIFMDEFIKTFFRNVSNASASSTSLEKIKGFVSAIPSISSMKSLMRYHRFGAKNAVFFKLSVDILACYYKVIGSPLFMKYKTEVIPIALLIYRTLPQSAVQEIYDDLENYNLSRSKV